MKKSLAECHEPSWFDTELLKRYRFIQAGNTFIQKDSALWRYKKYSGTSTVSKSVIWMSQEFYQVNNNNKSGREPKKGANVSQYFRLQFSSHADSWILLKSQWQKSSTLNANILLSKDQGTYAWILTPYSHDKSTFCDNFIYYLSSVKLMKTHAKLGVVYTQNKIGIFSATMCEINAPLWEYD